MNKEPAISDRQRKVDRFFRAGFVGGAAWAISFAFYMTLLALGMGQSSPLTWLNFGLFLVAFTAVIIQFRNRDADEFTAGHWNAAASWAFITTAGWMFFAVVIERWVAAALYYFTGTTFQPVYAYFLAFHVPMFIFYAVFFVRHLREM